MINLIHTLCPFLPRTWSCPFCVLPLFPQCSMDPYSSFAYGSSFPPMLEVVTPPGSHSPSLSVCKMQHLKISLHPEICLQNRYRTWITNILLLLYQMHRSVQQIHIYSNTLETIFSILFILIAFRLSLSLSLCV